MKVDCEKRIPKELANKLYLWFIAFLFCFGVIKGIYIFANLFSPMVEMARRQESYVPLLQFAWILALVSGPSIIIAMILFFLYHFFWKNNNTQGKDEVCSDEH